MKLLLFLLVFIDENFQLKKGKNIKTENLINSGLVMSI